MGKYYIYCSNNQAYNVLINNSILAKSVTRQDFRENTVSFLTNDYIFITKKRLQDEVKCIGISDVYYPVALEISDDEKDSAIPARLVTIGEDGSLNISEECPLSQYSEKENCVGAYILGEIPLAYLSGIVFEDDEAKNKFKKSSLDLWFPEELYKLWDIEEIDETIKTSLLTEVSEKADALMSAEEADVYRNLILKRIRTKAAGYYAIEATEGWNIGTIRSNLDATLIKYLDGDQDCLADEFRKCITALKVSDQTLLDNVLSIKDPVLDECEDNINKLIFNGIVNSLLNETNIQTKIPEEVFSNIVKMCQDLAGDNDKGEITTALNTLTGFLKSNMDPDEALVAMGKFDVLRSFMLFFDQQSNSDFLKRSCGKLNQNEKRYAYIMFALLNGMAEIERDWKSNRLLEYRLEELVCKYYASEHLISKLPQKENCRFLDMTSKDGRIYGISPVASVWYDCNSSQNILLNSASEKNLEKIYKLMVKVTKDDPIPERDVFELKKPVTVTVAIGNKKIKKFEISHKKDAKIFGKEIDQLVKKEKEIFNPEGFKKYLSDKKRYAKLYKKFAEEIQQYCKKA